MAADSADAEVEVECNGEFGEGESLPEMLTMDGEAAAIGTWVAAVVIDLATDEDFNSDPDPGSDPDPDPDPDSDPGSESESEPESESAGAL